jgi:DNA-binding NarL/FixJ family response regulator
VVPEDDVLPTKLKRPKIAQEFYVSLNTVNMHMRNIYAKLGVGDSSTGVQRALTYGFCRLRAGSPVV